MLESPRHSYLSIEEDTILFLFIFSLSKTFGVGVRSGSLRAIGVRYACRGVTATIAPWEARARRSMIRKLARTTSTATAAPDKTAGCVTRATSSVYR